MHKKLKTWSIIGVVVVFGLAAFWHFLYDLLPSGLIGAIAPVNESPWEHAKLFFIPAIIYYIILYFIAGRKYPNFLFAHSVALLIMPIFMLLFYYAYSSLMPGKETFVFDILNSLLTAALGASIGYWLTVSERDFSKPAYKIAAAVIVLGLMAVYVVFTFYPPECDMFYDDTQGKYGI